MTNNYSKNLWYVISLSLLLLSISFLANSDETTSNAYETTTSTTTSTESDVNAYDVNNSDVIFLKHWHWTLYLHQLMWKAFTSKSLWCPSPRPFFEKFGAEALVSSSVSAFFLFDLFKDNMSFKTNVHCVWQMST